jgi:hypothetical protein
VVAVTCGGCHYNDRASAEILSNGMRRLPSKRGARRAGQEVPHTVTLRLLIVAMTLIVAAFPCELVEQHRGVS